MKSTLILALALMPISMVAADQHKSESKGSAPHGGQSHASHGGGQSHAGQSHGGGQSHAGSASHGAGAAHENHGGE
ncbi:MAG: hypothetical protein WCC32_10940, partial [Terriglobales bacterium]